MLPKQRVVNKTAPARRRTLPVFSAVKNFFVTVELLPPTTETSKQQSVSAKTLSGDLRSEEREAEEERRPAQSSRYPRQPRWQRGGGSRPTLAGSRSRRKPKATFCNPQRPRPNFCQPTLSPLRTSGARSHCSTLQSRGGLRGRFRGIQRYLD